MRTLTQNPPAEEHLTQFTCEDHPSQITLKRHWITWMLREAGKPVLCRASECRRCLSATHASVKYLSKGHLLSLIMWLGLIRVSYSASEGSHRKSERNHWRPAAGSGQSLEAFSADAPGMLGCLDSVLLLASFLFVWRGQTSKTLVATQLAGLDSAGLWCWLVGVLLQVGPFVHSYYGKVDRAGRADAWQQ